MSAPAAEYTTSDGRTIRLAAPIGDPGGEGRTFRITGEPALVAKIYHKPPGREAVAKLEWMIAHPPAGASPAGGNVVLAWPISLLRDRSGAVSGFMMPLVDGAWPLSRLFDPVHRKRLTTVHGGPFGWHHLHEVARNLALVVQACHAAGYVVGDLNNNNTLVSKSGQISLIDTDSFQVIARNGRKTTVHHCRVVFPEYTPPELIGKDLARTERSPSADNYILAVLIYKLLQDGLHPFAGRTTHAEDPPADAMTLASRGWFPYDTRSKKVMPHPGAPTFGRLHPRLADLFSDCFVQGIHQPHRRPVAADWVNALTDARSALRQCANGHYFNAQRSGAVCLQIVEPAKGRIRYCGATETTRQPGAIPIPAVDPITGAVRRIPKPPKPPKRPTVLPPSGGAVKTGATVTLGAAVTRPPDPLLLRPFLALSRGVTGVLSAVLQPKIVLPALLLLVVLGSVPLGYADGMRGAVTTFWRENVTERNGDAASVAPGSGNGDRSSVNDDLQASGLAMLTAGQRGGLIIFSAQRGDVWSLEVLDPVRKVNEPVLTDLLIDPVPVWSNDGERIAFAIRYRHRVEIHLLDVGREAATVITRFEDRLTLTRLAWSGDDRGLLASIDDEDGPHVVQVSVGTGAVSAFLPVSSLNLTVSAQGETAYAVIEQGNANIVIGDARGDACCYVVRSPAGEDFPAFSPDGQWVAFSQNRGARQEYLSISSRDGDRQIPLQNQSPSITPVVSSWSPDGAGPGFAACEPDRCRIYLARFNGSLEILLSTSLIDRIGMISWQARSPAITSS